MIIGLVGFIGAGKGSVADILKSKYGYEKESFANGVKDATSVIFGWPRHLLEGDTVESRLFREEPDSYWSYKFERPFSPREALQLMGTEAGRNVFHTNLWIYSTFKRCQSKPDKNFVIADVRFPNEIKHIRENDGIIVRVKRGSDPIWSHHAERINRATRWDGSIQQIPMYEKIHYSEWAWIGETFDHVLTNNGTLTELHEKIAQMIKETAPTRKSAVVA